MKFGMNLLLWTGELNDGLLPILEKLKQMGYDGVEVPLFNLDLDYAAWGQRLDDLGFEQTAVTVRNRDDNPISPDASAREQGIANSKQNPAALSPPMPGCWSPGSSMSSRLATAVS